MSTPKKTTVKTGEKNPFLTMLRIVKQLGHDDLSSDELQDLYKISPATLKRYIADGRHLGADIVVVQKQGKSYYRLDNYTACKKLLLRWIELEENRCLIDTAQGVLIV